MKKRKNLVLLGLAVLGGLTACGSKGTQGEAYWKDARKAGDFEAFVEENGAGWDKEALTQEAASAENSYAQRFKAAALLCALEYENNRPEDSEASWKDGAFDVDYPDSAQAAESFLLQVVSGGDEFWTSFEDAFSPCDFFWPLLAAADNLDGQTITALVQGIPVDSSYKSRLEEAIEQWVKDKPEKLVDVGDALTDIGYFNDWSFSDWKSAFLYDYSPEATVKTETAGEGLAYISYIKKALPAMEESLGDTSSRKTSDLTGEEYYDTKLMVALEETLALKDAAEAGQGSDVEAGTEAGAEAAEGIELEGKKVLAFYRNLQADEFAGSPAPLQILGDFMMNLPEEEYPASAQEADYYLVLTPNYEYGEYYQTAGGGTTEIQEVYSSTSMDLYEASTGNLLRHIGNLMESPADTIFTSYDDTDAQYPQITAADVLSYIYHHVNEPDTYVAMLDHASGNSQLAKEESIILGNWEITYHSSELVGGFTHGMFQYDPKDGCKFAKSFFTITNRGTEEDGFLPMIYNPNEDVVVELVNVNTDTVYECVDLMSYGKCLNGSYLDPGETKDGELYFQVPESESTAELAYKVTLGRQEVYYPFE